MVIKDTIIKNYIQILEFKGEEGLYKHIVGTAILASVSHKNYEDYVLDLSEGFFALYRKQGEDKFFTIGKILRRAAHTVYRQLLKLNNKKRINKRFLQAI